MVKDGIGISFPKAGDSFVLCQRVVEALLQIVFGEVLLGQNLAEFRGVEHGYFAFTAPAP
jgi:hypothetical protein